MADTNKTESQIKDEKKAKIEELKKEKQKKLNSQTIIKK